MSQMNPPHFPKIYSNITFPFMPRFFEWSLPFRFSDQKFVRISRFSHIIYILGLLRNLLPLKMAELLGGFSTIFFFTG
jgi:hypothetical protein